MATIIKTEMMGGTQNAQALGERYARIIDLMLQGKPIPPAADHGFMDAGNNVPWNDERFRRLFVNHIDAIWSEAREGKQAIIKWEGIRELAALIGTRK